MSYLYGVSRETILAGGITAAEYAEGWRLLHIRDWRTPSANGAGTENIKVGADTDATGMNENTKYWSFGHDDGDVRDWIVSGDFSGFVWLPEGRNTTARLRIMWGQRDRAAKTDTMVWIFHAVQPEDIGGNYIVGSTSQGCLDVRVESAALQEPPQRYSYRIDDIDLPLTGWTDQPTMFFLGRDRDNIATPSDDDMDAPAIVYGMQVMVK